MNTKAIIFDKDGTLLDFAACWEPVARAATAEILKNLGRPDIPVEEIMQVLGFRGGVCSIEGVICYGTYALMTEKTLLALQNFDCFPTFKQLYDLTVAAYNNSIHLGEIKPTCPSLREVLKGLKNDGIILALVTLDDRECTRMCLEKLGIADLFDEVFTDDGEYPVKPHPHCINILADKYNLHKNSILMVGDTKTDLEFARIGGISAVAVAADRDNAAILTALGAKVIPDISFIRTVLQQIYRFNV